MKEYFITSAPDAGPFLALLHNTFNILENGMKRAYRILKQSKQHTGMASGSCSNSFSKRDHKQPDFNH